MASNLKRRSGHVFPQVTRSQPKVLCVSQGQGRPKCPSSTTKDLEQASSWDTILAGQSMDSQERNVSNGTAPAVSVSRESGKTVVFAQSYILNNSWLLRYHIVEENYDMLIFYPRNMKYKHSVPHDKSFMPTTGSSFNAPPTESSECCNDGIRQFMLRHIR